ncbi:MAG: hypothetical protein ACQEUZ_19025, partial [Pseudomonadota bacterium]
MTPAPGARSRRPARIAAAALAALTLPLLPARAPAQDAAQEPWVFVVHDGAAQGWLSKRMAKATDGYFADMMRALESWRAGPEGDPGFYDWLAEHQRAWEEVEGCAGKPLKDSAMVLSERVFELGFQWLLSKGYGAPELSARARGPRMEMADGEPVRRPGMANYITCQPDGFMATSNIGPDSSNLLLVGPRVNELVTRMPTLQLSATHELGHVVQNNLAPTKRSASEGDRALPNARWIIEGSADAIGVRHVQEHYGTDHFGEPYSDRYYRRFYLSRPYSLPLNLPRSADPGDGAFDAPRGRLFEGVDPDTLKKLDYQTNGFWLHVIERYLNGNPRGLNAVFRRLTAPESARNATRLVDRALNDLDGPLHGLEHVLPQFLSEYAAWWDHRFAGAMSRDRWLSLGFGGCPEVAFEKFASTARLSLDVAEYAGRCFTVRLDPAALIARPELEIRVIARARGVDARDVAEEMYLGRVSGRGFARDLRNQDCHEIAQDAPRPAPCLLSPQDGAL